MPILEIVSLVFGGVGGLVQKWLAAREEAKRIESELALLQAKQAFELAMEDKRRAYVQLEADNAARLAGIVAAKELGVAAEASLQASLAADKATYSTGRELTPRQAWLLVIVDFARGMTRPGLAWTLVAFLGWQLASLAPSDPAYQAVIDSVRALAGLSVGWWFGARDTSPATRGKQAGSAKTAMLVVIAIAAAGVMLALSTPAWAHGDDRHEHHDRRRNPPPVSVTVTRVDHHDKGMCDGWGRFLTCAAVGSLAVYGLAELPVWKRKDGDTTTELVLAPSATPLQVRLTW